MAEVAIAVPVRNGAPFLTESLDCLRAQSFRDIEIVVFDNASDDATPKIASEFAAQDPRFRLARQPRDIGMLGNFLTALEDSSAEFFMWRADDDLSDAGYVETLLARLKAEPSAELAVPRVAVSDIDGGRRRDYSPLAGLRDRGAAAILRRLFAARASWYYGLWRREALVTRYRRVLELYPREWGHDHLTLFGPLVAGRVVASDEAVFHQRYKRAGAPGRRPPPAAAMWAERRAFAAACRTELASIPGLTVAERLAVRAALPFYAGKRSHRLTKIAARLAGG